MQTSKSVEQYQQYFDEYLSRLAKKEYPEALKCLDHAISECPVREAISSLAARRATLVHDMTTFSSYIDEWRKKLSERSLWKKSG